ncbi:hypothetical protein Tco_0919786 [Tanacetum coccineum]
MADEQMVVPAVGEIAEQMVVRVVEEVDEPVAEAEKEPMIAPVVDIGEGQMDAPMMDMEEDLAALFDDDDFEDDASDGFGEEEVSDAEVAAGVTIGELGPWVYAVKGQVQVVVSQMAHAVDRWEQVGAQVEQGQQTVAQRDETVVELIQHVQALQIDVQHRDTQIQQLQTTVTEMSSRESSLMQCILGLDNRLAALKRRPPGS